MPTQKEATSPSIDPIIVGLKAMLQQIDAAYKKDFRDAADLSGRFLEDVMPVKKSDGTGTILYGPSMLMTAVFVDRHARSMFAIRNMTEAERYVNRCYVCYPKTDR